MNIATEILQLLRAELGEQAEALRRLPLDKFETASLEDEEAISFGILFGYMEDPENPGEKQAMWLHMYPATRPRGHPEIHVNVYSDGNYRDRIDPSDACKWITECSVAFRISGTWFKGKLTALAKYYFLEKLSQTAVDYEKMHYGMSINKTFLHDLKAACDLFEQKANVFSLPSNNDSPNKVTNNFPNLRPDRIARSSIGSNSSARRVISGNSTLTDVPSNLSDYEGDETMRDSPSESAPTSCSAQAAESLPTPEPSYVGDAALSNLLLLDKAEADILDDVDALNEQITKLQRKRTQREQELRQIHNRKDEIFQGLSSTDAYNLGRQVQLAHMKKRKQCE